MVIIGVLAADEMSYVLKLFMDVPKCLSNPGVFESVH